MPEETTATLKDASVSDTGASTAVLETAQTTDTATKDTPTVDATAGKDALEIGQILLDNGVTKEQLNDLLEAPRALESIRSLIQNNPAEFMNLLERTDPKAHEKLLETGADRFVDRYGEKGKQTDATKGDSSNDLMREVQALRAETNELKTAQAKREQAAALAAANQRYEGRVEDLMGTKEIKELNLTKAETKNLKARLNSELASDQAIVRRVSNGNFVDVPRVFKTIVEELASDRKAQVDAEKAQRDGTARRSFSEFQSGPNPFAVDIPSATFDSWDATEVGFAQALERAR